MRFKKWAIALGAAAMTSGSALAGGFDLEMRFDGLGTKIDGFSYFYEDGNGVNKSGNSSAGQFNWTVTSSGGGFTAGQSLTTFCIELTQFINPGTIYGFDTTNAGDAPNPDSNSPGNMGAVRASVLAGLMAKYYAVGSTAMFGESYSLFGNMYAGKVVAGALQLATWEIVHENTADDTNAVTLLSGLQVADGAGEGNFHNRSGMSSSDANDATALADMLLDSLDGSALMDGDIIAFTNPLIQDQIILIPVPAPAMLAGLGLIGIIAIRRRLKA